MLVGDVERFEAMLRGLVSNVLSVHDNLVDAPERVYHSFVIGLFAWLEPGHQVRSERESGYGRSDVLILPTTTDDPGAVLEF